MNIEIPPNLCTLVYFPNDREEKLIDFRLVPRKLVPEESGKLVYMLLAYYVVNSLSKSIQVRYSPFERLVRTIHNGMYVGISL
jgi:hypothetical protein